MAAFYHFVPGAQRGEITKENKLTDEFLAQWKLDKVLDDCRLYPDQCQIANVSRGPNNQPGVVLYPRPVDMSNDPKIWNYQPDRQTWVESADGTGRYIGWLNDHPPTPDDLARREIVSCRYELTDDHGRRWLCVTAYADDPAENMLPAYYDFDNGKITRVIKEKYLSLWDLAGQMFDHWAASGVPADEQTEEVTAKIKSEEWLVNAAVTSLSVNYRIGIGEISALAKANLGLLDARSVANINYALINYHLIDDYHAWMEKTKQKKTTDQDMNASNASPGSEGKTAITESVVPA